MSYPPSVLQRHRLRREAALVEAEAARLRELDAAAFGESLTQTRAALRRGRVVPGALSATAFALAHLVVVATRALAQAPRPLQIQAALAIFQNRIVWLPAGAGKSLAIALAAVLHGWSGHPCRIAMASAYLARRDSERLRPLYTASGLELACVTEAMASEPALLLQAYGSEVVYAGARQMLADTLREQIMRGAVDDPLRLRLRGYGGRGGTVPPRRIAMLVDDADLVLNDDAGTPLIISAPGDNPLLLDALRAAREVVAALQPGRDYRHVPARRDIELSPAGQERIEGLGERLPGIWHEPDRRDDLIRQAIGVRDLLENGRHYRVEEGKVVILDDGISRMLTVRGWSQGLIQAIEAREGLEFTMPSRTLARMSYPVFFRRHAYLGGAGRGYGGIDALLRDAYGLAGLRLAGPDAAPVAERHPCLDREAKLDALADQAARLRAARKPVLIISRRMGDSEALTRRLAAASIPCDRLDPRNIDDDVLSRLVEPGRVSMTQSGTLQGVSLPHPAREALHCLLVEPHDLTHADHRVAALGTGHYFLAFDDDLLRLHLPRTSAWFRRREDSSRWLPALARLAQRLAMRAARKQGKLAIRRDAMLNQQLAFTGEQDIDLGIYALGNPAKD